MMWRCSISTPGQRCPLQAEMQGSTGKADRDGEPRMEGTNKDRRSKENA